MSEVSIDKLGSELGKISKQFDFAGVVTLTRLAKHGQAVARESFRDKFQRRNRWTESGIRIVPATKQTREAQVYSRDWYIAQHEKGERRVAPRSDEFQIPVALRQVAGVDGSKLPPKRLKGKAILKSKVNGRKPFVLNLSSGKRGIFVRTSGDRLPIRMLYNLREEPVTIKAKPWFHEPVVEAYDENLNKEFSRALRDALRSAT